MEKATPGQEGKKDDSQPSSPVDPVAAKEGKVSRSLSPTEASAKSSSAFEDSFDYPEDETARSRMISAAVQQEDEFLEYLMSLPTVANERKSTYAKTSKQPQLMRSTSEKAGAKVGLDHLDNLCKLMEQLGDLREQNSKLQRRVQYLEDLKNLQEMHKQLQQETTQQQLQEAELLQSLQRHREASSFPCDSPRRSKKLSRHRQSLQPSAKHRERSHSMGIDDINDFPEDFPLPTKQTKRRQRRSIAGFASSNKSKVSKWTKVKEAFRWEKASVVMSLPETKSQDSGLGGINHHDTSRYLRVPVGEMLSGSPSADSVISGHSMCSSGGPSGGEYALPMTTTMSSSSSSDDLEIDLNYSDMLDEFGPQRSASASDTIGAHLLLLEPRRLSLSRALDEEEASRRTKSLDGDETPSNRHSEPKQQQQQQQPKSHRTPWGKVKDIIQTRKDSLRQRQHRSASGHGESVKSATRPRRRSQKADARDAAAAAAGAAGAASDHDDDAPVFDNGEMHGGDATSPQCDDNAEGQKSTKLSSDSLADARRHKTSTASLGSYPTSALTNRRLTPMLTITLPSTEELRQLSGMAHAGKCVAKPPPSPQVEERTPKLAPITPDDAALAKHEYRQQGGVSPSASVGTSPPAHRRSSKWTKVKKAFLTSTATGSREDDGCPGQLSVSGPSSPYRTLSFFYETDPDELSGGELAEGTGDDEDPHRVSTSEPTSLQVEIQRNYEELQQKLSQEFHKKLNEWERMKASASSSGAGRASAGAGGGVDDSHHDKGFKRKMDEWEKMKHRDATAGSGKRDSVALQPVDEDNLSPHFRKKLHEWQRIKKGTPAPAPREEGHQARKKIVEWQLWRTGSGKQGNYDQEEFHRKLQEWERMKSASPCESPTSKEAGHESDRNSSGAKTPSPGVARKDSLGGGIKKSSSGGGKAPPKAKTQKEKELQWLEKELQKIKREKQRLEREREKYLERESRLEKMRRAVGSSPGKQEVLVQTSTGFFRFQGISEKFTRRLYEWEKARGITPEASTFALLDPGYRPPGGGTDAGENGGLTRSKSASSVTNLAGGGLGATITHQPSSLSLNDVEGLEQAALTEARSSSEPHLRDAEEAEYDEPAAVIVDVEDVVVETAALLEATPVVEGHTPVYCYAPEEVTRLIDSSGSDSERDGSGVVRRTDSVRTESSYKLIEENINLLSKLQIKGDICRKLETELEELEQKIDHVRETHELEIERLRLEETEIQELASARAAVSLAVPEGLNSGEQEALVDALRSRIHELERRQERLRREGATLKDSFAVHSEQQAALAQNLVGKMKQLKQVNSNMASVDQDQEQDQRSSAGCLTGSQEDAVTMVQELSTQLLTLAERLEVALGERNSEIRSLRFELEDRRRGAGAGPGHLRRRLSEDNSSSTSPSLDSFTAPDNINLLSSTRQYLPRQTSTEVSQLPSLLTSKVMELKQGLNILCSTSSEPRAKEKDSDETTTFVLKIPTKREAPSEATASPPVTSVTITPAFLQRQKRVTESEGRSTAERDLGASPSRDDVRESFCSAQSSSASSSNDIHAAKNFALKTVEDRRRCGSDDDVEKNKKVLKSFKLTRSLGNVGLQLKLAENGKSSGQDGNSSPAIQRKVFSTRRASDTNVAYKGGGRGLRSDSALSASKSSSNTKLIEDSHTSIQLPRKTNHGLPESSKDNCDVGSSQSMGETNALVNVFVPTTRKIFAPVRRDSKGTASSVIGYVVEEDSEVKDDAGGAAAADAGASKSSGIATTPQWMIMRSRSASASPAMPRRKIVEDGAEGVSGFPFRGLRTSPELGKLKLSSESLKENEQRKLSRFIRDENAEITLGGIKIDSQREMLLSSVRPTTPLGFPPLPPSPGPGRRDLFKQIAKDTAPSIRMMIAKYNQKLTEQDGGRSPEVTASGAGSPVAWRSPVAERRVRAQMTKYQEEVQRVLQQGGRRAGRPGHGEVQKSASAGVIRSPDANKTTKCGSIGDKIGSPSKVERRGILKSSSAGSIKPFGELPLSKPVVIDAKLEIKLEPTSEAKKASPLDKPPATGPLEPPCAKSSAALEVAASPDLSAVASTSQCRGSDASSDVGSPPPTRLRALRIQKAKEEFLTRGPGGRSWTSDQDTPTPSTSSVSLEPVWIKNPAQRCVDTTKNRLSQVSVGSESSYGSQVLPYTPEDLEEDDDGSLMKSASAGMIHVDTKTYKTFALESGTDSLPRTHKEKTNSHNKFGISSLTSKFRKVKMRKSKDKEGGAKQKMNTVSLLCRQSLLVDINKKEGGVGAGGNGEGPSASLSKSCPSSPVLQRTTSTENTSRQETATGSWISYPARKIFKPK